MEPELTKTVDSLSVFTEGFLLTGEKDKIPVSLETPRHTSLVLLPSVDAAHGNIRNCMHTDTVGQLLRFLSQLDKSKLEALKIEGRVLNKDQWERLQNDRLYRFYLFGRADRADSRVQGHILKFLAPADLKVAPAEFDSLIKAGFSPASSSAEIGYGAGYYDAKFLVDLWQDEFITPNSFMPLFGGCNQFRIGSDSLDQTEINLLKMQLRRNLTDSQNQVVTTTASVATKVDDSTVSSFQIS